MRDAQVNELEVRSKKLKAAVRILLTFYFLLFTFSAERFGYPPEEFSARRDRLVTALRTQRPDGGTVILFGASTATPGVRFRQDHDFYYLTGSEALNAVLVMDVPSGDAHIFMPKLSATQVQFNGGNWLDESGAAKKYGFASVQPLPALAEFLMKRRRSRRASCRR